MTSSELRAGHARAQRQGEGRSQARRARYVPDRVSLGGDSRSLMARQAKMPQISISARRPRIADETSQADGQISNASSNTNAPDRMNANHLEHVSADQSKHRTASDGFEAARARLTVIRGSALSGRSRRPRQIIADFPVGQEWSVPQVDQDASYICWILRQDRGSHLYGVPK
jgi:hypothetical protein